MKVVSQSKLSEPGWARLSGYQLRCNLLRLTMRTNAPCVLRAVDLSAVAVLALPELRSQVLHSAVSATADTTATLTMPMVLPLWPGGAISIQGYTSGASSCSKRPDGLVTQGHRVLLVCSYRPSDFPLLLQHSGSNPALCTA